MFKGRKDGQNKTTKTGKILPSLMYLKVNYQTARNNERLFISCEFLMENLIF